MAENEYKTHREILSGTDEIAIKNILTDYIGESVSYFDQIKSKMSYYKSIYDSIFPIEYPLTVSYFIPMTRRIVDTVTGKLFGAMYSEEPYWGEIAISKNEDKAKQAQVMSEILKENLYDFNNFHIEKEATIRSAIIYGMGVEKDSWETIERPINFREKITVESINTENINKTIGNKEPVEKNEKEVIEIDSSIESDIEVLKDANSIENVSIWDIGLDPTATGWTPETARFIRHKHWFNDDELYEKFDNANEWITEINKKTDDLARQASQPKKTMGILGQGVASSIGETSDYSVEDDIEDTRKYRENHLTLVQEIYTFTGHLFWVVGYSSAIFLLKPKGTTDKTKYLNPFNHGSYPYMPFYFQYDKNNIYGRGLVEQIAPLNLAANDFFNLTIESFLMQLKTPTGINPSNISPSDFQNAMNTPNGIFMIEDTQNVHNALVRPDLHFSSVEMFNAYKEMDSQTQLQSAVSNFQSGGVATNQYTQTLGGINQILSESLQKMTQSIKSNQSFLKEQIFRMLSNVFQFQRQESIIKIIDDKTPYWIKIVRDFDNTKTDDVWVNDSNKEIYTFDELAKLKYTIDINFAVGKGSLSYRMSQLDTALRYSVQLLSTGQINIMPIVREIFDKLDVHNVVRKDARMEQEQIEAENTMFIEKLQDIEQLVKMGELTELQAQLKLDEAVPPAKFEEDHTKHMSEHLPQMEAHLQTHRIFLEQQQLMAQQLQQQAQQPPMEGNVGIGQGAPVPTSDGRTMTSNTNQKTEVPTQQN